MIVPAPAPRQLLAGSLFSGYGGLDRAIEAIFDVKTAWVSDIDPGACKVLAHRFPGVPNLGDVSKVDWSTVPRVYVLGGGFPCQDVSGAGRQAGLVEGTRSGLWHEFARAIRELRPVHVVIENVRGLLSARGAEPTPEHLRAEATRDAYNKLLKWIDARIAYAVRQGRTDDVQRLATRRARTMGCRKRAVARARWHERRLVRAIGTVLGTLADLGYDAQWYCVRASDVGAPHERFRVFILATAQDADLPAGGQRWLAAPGQEEGGRARPDAGGRDRAPVALLRTPQASEAQKAVDGQGVGHRKDGNHQVWLSNQIADLLPTPVTDPGSANGHAHNLGRETRMLPTPTTTQRGTDALATDRDGSGPNLHNAVALLPTPAVNDMGKAYTPDQWDAWTDKMKAAHGNGNGHGKSLEIEAARLLPTPSVAAAEGGQTSRSGDRKDEPLLGGIASDPVLFGQYEAAVRRWESITGMVAPPPTEPTGKDGAHRLSPRFTEWMMGQPAGWITDVPGITRNEALKLSGNGVVTQQAIAALAEMVRAQVAA